MSDMTSLFAPLRQSADPDIAAAIERLVADAPDRRLCRINVVAFAAENGLDEEKAVAAFLHAARLGLFEMSWNVLCPGCGGRPRCRHVPQDGAAGRICLLPLRLGI